MVVKNVVDKALNTPMNRKEFLGQVGAVMLAVIGVSSIMHALSHSSSGLGATGHQQSGLPQGYGAMPYGGGTDR